MNYDRTKFKVYSSKHPVMLLWITNPGLAFNELVLGQRIPKVILIERNSTKSHAEKTFIPCPHCGTVHPGIKWSKQNNTALRNWFGLYCDNCGNIIPCLTNLTSYILLGLTFPIWYWFKDKWKSKWLENQKAKFSKPLNLEVPEFKWWLFGLLWGLFMYVFMTAFMALVIQLVDGEWISQRIILIGIPIWTVAGFAVGLMAKILNGKKQVKTVAQ